MHNRHPWLSWIAPTDGPDDTGGGSAGNPGSNPETETATGVTLSQAAIDAMLGREKSKASRSALKQFAIDQGYESVEAMQTAITAKKTEDDARKSELERQMEAANARATKAAEAEATANAKLYQARVKEALLIAGVPPVVDGKPNTDVLNAAARLVETGPDADDEDVAKAIEKVKTLSPGWFTGTSTPAPQFEPGRGPNNGNHAPSPVADAIAQAKAISQRLNDSGPKTSTVR